MVYLQQLDLPYSEKWLVHGISPQPVQGGLSEVEQTWDVGGGQGRLIEGNYQHVQAF